MRKGFTLIELLAVIVILAIISLIATPIILGIINDAKEESKDRSVEIIIDSAQIFAADKELKGGLELDQNIYDEIVNEINGDRPDTGQVYINKHGEVALSLRYGDYCYTKSYGEKKYYKEKTDEECITPFYYLPKTTVDGVADSGEVYFLNESGDTTKPLIKKSEIEKIVTVASNLVPDDVLGSWSVGVDKDNNPINGKVMAWYKDEDNDGLYEVYIGQEGGVKANPGSHRLFAMLTNLTEIDLSKLDTSNVTSMYSMFESTSSLTSLDLSSFDTSKVTIIGAMFKNCKNLINLDLSTFDTSKVSSLAFMFNGCSNLTTLDVTSFNTSNVTNMEYMFYNCSSLTSLDLSSFDTSNVTAMNDMFNNCSSLTTLDLSNFNTAKVKKMNGMFATCKSLTSLDISNFNTSKVTQMRGMFNNCRSITSLDLSHFNTSNVTSMGWMFNDCENLKTVNLTSFDTKNVTEMSYMFYGGRNLKVVLVGKGWTTENADTTNLFGNRCANNVCGTDHVTLK